MKEAELREQPLQGITLGDYWDLVDRPTREKLDVLFGIPATPERARRNIMRNRTRSRFGGSVVDHLGKAVEHRPFFSVKGEPRDG